MNIALLTPTFCKFSGIDRVVEQQAKEFARRGNKVIIFAFEADLTPPKGVMLQVLRMPRNLFWQRVYRLLFPLDFVKTAVWLPKLKGIDIIYAHQYPMTWLALLARKFYGAKYIYYDYGLPPPKTFPNFIERLYLNVFIPVAIWTIKPADAAISISHYLQLQLAKATGLVSQVAYPTVDTRRFHNNLNGLQVRQRYNLGDCPVVLYVGRISPHKGIHLLIEAFKLVKHRTPDARLLIAGKHTFPSYSDKLRQTTDGSIIFAGPVADEELPYYYAACDVYATATMWEGFNLPLVEAQACGKPVVAFNLGPHPEVVTNGKTGFLTQPGNITAFAEAIVRLLTDHKLREEMGANAYEMASKKFASGEEQLKTPKSYEPTKKLT